MKNPFKSFPQFKTIFSVFLILTFLLSILPQVRSDGWISQSACALWWQRWSAHAEVRIFLWQYLDNPVIAWHDDSNCENVRAIASYTQQYYYYPWGWEEMNLAGYAEVWTYNGQGYRTTAASNSLLTCGRDLYKGTFHKKYSSKQSLSKSKYSNQINYNKTFLTFKDTILDDRVVIENVRGHLSIAGEQEKFKSTMQIVVWAGRNETDTVISQDNIIWEKKAVLTNKDFTVWGNRRTSDFKVKEYADSVQVEFSGFNEEIILPKGTKKEFVRVTGYLDT
jgi:hypothetical protein